MQSKRKKRSRIRAAKITAGHGHKKKNRGAGHRGGRGKSGTGKRGDAKIMKVTAGTKHLGKTGFKTYKKKGNSINLQNLQSIIPVLIKEGKAKQNKDVIEIDLTKLGYDKVISKGPVKLKLHITTKFASQNVISKVEAANGKVVLPEVKKEEPIDVKNIEENK